MIPRAKPVFGFVLTCLALIPASPALAQYMYLDTDGDGVHTAADAVNPNGPTTVDIWLDIATDRDGTPVSCDVNPSRTVDMFSYVAVLRSNGGTISWGTFTNRQGTFFFHFGPYKNETQFYDGYGGSTGQPPGRYLLATLTLTVSSGTPSIEIAPYATIGLFESTSFGSHCPGILDDNTLRLGSEWHDADGLPFGTIGGPNQPPVLVKPQDMTVATGELALQSITASDPDRQPLTFSKASGPSYLNVSTRDVGLGTATGTLAAAPLVSDVGTATAAVLVTDGLSSTQEEFQIVVTPGPNHAPITDPIANLIVVAGTTPRIPVLASDSDGQPLSFQKLEGPDYLEVATLSSGPGGAAGILRLTPGACDAGADHAALEVTDGIVASLQDVEITVKLPRPAATQPPYLAAGRSTVVGAADLNGDGHLDILSSGLQEPIYTLLGKGDGTFAPATTQPLITHPSEPTSIAFGDWNADGRVDAALTVTGINKLLVLSGTSSGELGNPVEYPTGGFPWIVRSVDLDHDGKLDLVFTHGPGVGVMLGQGDGSFAARTDYAAGDSPRGLAIADFNLDGRLDLAVANMTSKNVTLRFGTGHGVFGDASSIPIAGVAFDVVAADWNGDGKIDLAIADATFGLVRIYEGHGDGTFSPGVQLSGYDGFARMEARDLNWDGKEDIVAAVSSILSVTVVAHGKGDGTFEPKRNILEAENGLATGDFNEDGFADVVSTVDSPDPTVRAVRLWLNDAGGAGMPEARAFAESKGGGKPATCVRLEPVTGYRNAEVDPTSLTLSPENGSGSIHAITTKAAAIEDTDGNGIAEVPACFPRDDLAALFDARNGRQTVTALLQGALVDGRRFCTSVSLDIIGTGKRLAASLSPNPLNPGGILRLTTSRDGFIRVRMFDLQGRVVRVLEDRAMVPAGAHDVRIDGRNTAGQTLASGIYFYQVDTAEGSLKGRITVLK